MKLTVFVIDGQRLDIRPPPVERDWMEASRQRFAYRCLPLSTANAHGWELLCSAGFGATWNGEPGMDAITIIPDSGAATPALSNFGHGVLTFHVSCIFRSEPGFDLMVQGPVNRPKDGIGPLSGIIETDWSPYTFTMNWLFTRPNTTIRFEKGEPYCHVFPIQRAVLETVNPELCLLSEEPALKQQFEQWQHNRSVFNIELRRRGSGAQEQGWQKLYHRGLTPDGSPSNAEHRTRIKLKPFVRSSHYNQAQRSSR
jgi:hypothetical protein